MLEEIPYNDEHSSLSPYGINYGCREFYYTAPRAERGLIISSLKIFVKHFQKSLNIHPIWKAVLNKGKNSKVNIIQIELEIK